MVDSKARAFMQHSNMQLLHIFKKANQAVLELSGVVLMECKTNCFMNGPRSLLPAVHIHSHLNRASVE